MTRLNVVFYHNILYINNFERDKRTFTAKEFQLHYYASTNCFYDGYVIYIRGCIIYLARKLCSWIYPVYRLVFDGRQRNRMHEHTHAPDIFYALCCIIVRPAHHAVLFIDSVLRRAM